MKFLETLDGTFVNFEEISHFTYLEKKDKYYSYLILKNGIQFDFLEFPSSWIDSEQVNHEFDGHDANEYTRCALEYIIENNYSLYHNSELCDNAWALLMNKYEKANLK